MFFRGEKSSEKRIENWTKFRLTTSLTKIETYENKYDTTNNKTESDEVEFWDMLAEALAVVRI